MDPLTTGVAAPLIAVLGEVIAHKGIDAAVGWLRDSSWRQALAAQAAAEAGIPSAIQAVKSWLDRPETAALLASSDFASNVDQLTTALERELADEWTLRVGTVPTDNVPLRSIADSILTSVLTNFIASLDPSRAVAIADSRAEARHKELQADLARVEAVLSAGDKYADARRHLPPTARSSISTLHELDPPKASALMRLVTSDAQAPGQALRELFRGPEPELIRGGSAEFWIALADLAAAYGVREVEATTLDRAVNAGISNRGRVMARAAMALAANGDMVAARQHLESAKAISAGDSFIELIDASLASDSTRVLAASEHLSSFVSGTPVAFIRALALVDKQRIDEAIDLLREALDETPEWTSGMLWLANLKLSKSESTRSGDVARRLRDEAFALSSKARDLRRQWRGLSGECSEVMARAAFSLGNRRLALKVGLPPPEGEATSEEASWPGVVELVVILLLDVGDLRRAEELARKIDSPYFQSLAMGAVAADSGRAEEALVLLNQALGLARHEGERWDVIRHMATAGIWPLPDFDKMKSRDPEAAAFVAASSSLARNDPRAAITALRPYRRSGVRIARFLAHAYQKADQLDNAVDELLDAAKHFRDPDLRAEAALMLEDASRLDQAFNLATKVVAEMQPSSLLLPRLRILLYRGLLQRSDWHGAEEQARRLSEIEPLSPDAGWALVNALTHQMRLDEAWAVVTDRQLPRRTLDEARVWVGLAGRYIPPAQWVPEGLDLIHRFPDSEELCATVLISIVRHPEPNLPPDVGERVRQTWTDFLSRFPESEIIRAQKVGDTEAEILQSLRTVLEPGAQEAIAQSRAIDDGNAPLGLVATSTGRSYIEAWLLGGTGVLQVHTPNDDRLRQETLAAAQALDQAIVLDGSALAILSLIPDVSSVVISAFASCHIPNWLRTDAVKAHDASSAPSVGVLSWNVLAQRPVLQETSPDEAADRLRRSEWIERATMEFEASEVSELPGFPNVETERWLWLSALQLAINERLPFYCDDLWLRQLASSMGVPAFGTVDLLALLSSTGRVEAAAHEAARQTLRSSRVVFIPISREDLVLLAQSEGWRAEVAALQVAQPAFWAGPEASQLFESVLLMVSRNNSVELPNWLGAGMIGAARNSADSYRLGIVSRLLAAGIANYGQPESVPRLVEAARAAASRVGAGDPLPVSAPVLRDLLVARLGYRNSVIAVVNLAANLSPQDAQVLKLPFFATGASV
jgi:tetratricopeptide (TPR) repeat protein